MYQPSHPIKERYSLSGLHVFVISALVQVPLSSTEVTAKYCSRDIVFDLESRCDGFKWKAFGEEIIHWAKYDITDFPAFPETFCGEKRLPFREIISLWGN